ncbi:MAG: HD-GYP domain-containing protein [Actinomycetia bacterium]|nr:HD-GYP domain-containing protein [Actinomycetes bacterium]
MTGPTRGASDQRRWEARRGRAFAVRAVLLLAPILLSLAVTRLAARVLWHPTGWSGFLVFACQIGVVGITTALWADRVARRLLPLASLLNMTLVFPDQAPSRFAVALRSGTLKQLDRQITEVGERGLSSDHQQAAEQLVALMAALGRHERLTRGHAERVRAYAETIAEEMGLSVADRELLRWAALAHDIGKLAVPAEILNKEDPLTDEEWAVLQTHPAEGARMVEPLAGWLGDWRLAAGQHHERWDGTGYPARLAGTDISLAGRVIAVADAFDVITSSRSYKAPMTPVAARAELVRCSGTQFDAEVVAALLTASVSARRSRLATLVWLTELRGFGMVSETVIRTAANAATAAAVTVGAVTAGPAVIDDGPSAAGGLGVPTALGFLDEAPASSTTVASTQITGVTVPPDIAPIELVEGTVDLPSVTATPTATVGSTTTGSTTIRGALPATTSLVTTTALPTLPAVSQEWYLGSGGFTTAQDLLPLSGALISGALPNYDTDRDNKVGLLVMKGDGLAEADPRRIQRWFGVPANPIIQGTAYLELWAAARNFSLAASVTIDAGIYDCEVSGADCLLLGSGTVTIDQSGFGTDFGRVVIGLGGVNSTIAPGRALMVKVAPPLASEGQVWVAYGTTAYPTRLFIS